MMLALDTDVMIDLLRGFPAALKWLSSLNEIPALPGFVVMELLEGCRNKLEMTKIMRLCDTFRILWPDASDCERSLQDLLRAKLSHGLGIMDALIAECVIGGGASLHTFNEKHFRAVPLLRIVKPYSRGE
jgi:predicted nucleic acid-binding protein